MFFHAYGRKSKPGGHCFSENASANKCPSLSICHKASKITPDNDALQHEKIFLEIYFVFIMIVRTFGGRKLQLKLFIL